MLSDRTSHLSFLQECAKSAAKSNGKFIVVAAESGAGKTTMIKDFFLRVDSDFRTVIVNCDPAYTPVVLTELQPKYAREKPQNVDNSNIKISHLYSEIFSTICDTERPTVLAIENLQWADDATIGFIRYARRRISLSKCVLVCSVCTNAHFKGVTIDKLKSVIQISDGELLRIQPLTFEEINELQSSVGRKISNLFELSGGNAFLVDQLINSDIPDVGSIHRVLDSKLLTLSKPLREFVEILSLTIQSVSITVINMIDPINGEDCLNTVIETGFLICEGEKYHFRHEILRRMVEKRVPIDKQLKHHSRLIDIFEKLDEEVCVSVLLYHANKIADGKRIVRYAKDLSNLFRSIGAHSEAAKSLKLALQHINELSMAGAASLYEDWAFESSFSLHISDSVLQARRAAISFWQALDREEKIGENFCHLSKLHWFRGESVQANHCLQKAIKILEKNQAHSQIAFAYSLRSQQGMLNHHFGSSIRWGKKALEVEKLHPNIEVRIHALNNVGTSMYSLGSIKGIEFLESSLDLALKHKYDDHAARAYVNYADTSLSQKRLDETERIVTEGISFGITHDIESKAIYLNGIQAKLRVEQGQLDEAEEISKGLLSIEKSNIIALIPAISALAKSSIRLYGQDGGNEVYRFYDLALESGEQQYIVDAKLCLVEFFWLIGDSRAAFEKIQSLLDNSYYELDYWQVGEAVAWAKRFGFDVFYMPDRKIPLPFQLEIDNKHIEATDAWLELGVPYNAALCLIQSEEGKHADFLLKAKELATNMGARALVAKIYEVAKSRKIRLTALSPKRGVGKSTKRNPLGLTSKELAILAEIVNGKSNMEISRELSRSIRTIEHHVSSILHKLNVSNRLEAILRIQNEPWLLRSRSNDAIVNKQSRPIL